MEPTTSTAATADHRQEALSLLGLVPTLDAVQANVIVADAALDIVYVNPACLVAFEEFATDFIEEFGFTAADLVGRSLAIFSQAEGGPWSVLGDPANLPHTMELAFSAFTLGAQIDCVDNGSEPIGWVVTWRNITAELAARAQVIDHAQNSTAVTDVVTSLATARSVDEVARTALDAVRRSFDWANGCFWSLDGDVLKVTVESGVPGTSDHRDTVGSVCHPGAGLAGRAVERGELVFEPDLGAVADCTRSARAEAEGMRSGVAFPVIADRRVIGAIDFVSAESRPLSAQRIDALRTIAQAVSGAVERAQQEAEIVEAATRERDAAQDLHTKVDALLAIVEAAAAGDLTAIVPDFGDDLIGQVGLGLAKLLADLRGSIAHIGGSADGLSTAASGLLDISGQMGRSAGDTSQQAASVSSASEQVASNIETVATATEEMTASIKEIARNASDAAKVAGQAVSVAAETNTTVAKLGESSAEIGKIVKVITAIAQQTNLLALNATIEAARAGDAGRGFAVVANEVKELAKATASATEDIAHKVEAIQADSGGATTAIGQISEIIDQISDYQNTIATAVEEQAATTAEIARNVSEANRGSSEIAEIIGTVAGAAQAAATGAADSTTAAEGLARMAEELRSLVGRFTY